MFVTTPQFEQFVPRELVGPNQKYWRAVTLSLETPWYLVTCDAEVEGQPVSQTTLVAWETTLLSFIAVVPKSNLNAIARLDRHSGQVPCWVLRTVERIWKAAEAEGEDRGGYVFQFEGTEEKFDEHSQPVPDKLERELLYSR